MSKKLYENFPREMATLEMIFHEVVDIKIKGPQYLKGAHKILLKKPRLPYIADLLNKIQRTVKQSYCLVETTNNKGIEGKEIVDHLIITLFESNSARVRDLSFHCQSHGTSFIVRNDDELKSIILRLL